MRLMMVLYSLIATVMACTGVVMALTMGQVAPDLLGEAAGAGAVLALPVSWFVSRSIN